VAPSLRKGNAAAIVPVSGSPHGLSALDLLRQSLEPGAPQPFPWLPSAPALAQIPRIGDGAGPAELWRCSRSHLAHTATRQAPQSTEAHTYFIGRRGSDAAEVYAVTVTSVERLRPKPSVREPSLDWHGSEAAAMELSYLLISRLVGQRPSRDLQARFALYVLNRLPNEGFVLDSHDLSRWLRIADDAQESVPAPAPRRSWLRRRARHSGSPRQGKDG
jgi:hypothetical protein